MWDAIWTWIKRILAIGLMEFLRSLLKSLGWKVFAGALLALVALGGLVVVLILLVLQLLF